MSVALSWLSHKRQYVKRSTYAVYCNHVYSHLIPSFGQRTRITEKEVQDFVDRELERGRSLKTVKDVLVVLKMVLRFWEKCGALPATRIDVVFPTKREKSQLQVLSVSSQKRLMGYVREHFSFRNLGILICLSSGLRIGEIWAQDWGDMCAPLGRCRPCRRGDPGL